MNLKRYRIDVTTIADGSGSDTHDKYVRGFVHKVVWMDGDYADGVDAVLSVTETPAGVDETLLTLTNANVDDVYYVSTVESDQVGADRTTTTRLLIEGKLKLDVTNGGDTKTGGVIVYVESLL
jgi:hypothetical protein